MITVTKHYRPNKRYWWQQLSLSHQCGVCWGCEVSIVPRSIFGLFWVCELCTAFLHTSQCERTSHAYALKISSAKYRSMLFGTQCVCDGAALSHRDCLWDFITHISVCVRHLDRVLTHTGSHSWNISRTNLCVNCRQTESYIYVGSHQHFSSSDLFVSKEIFTCSWLLVALV